MKARVKGTTDIIEVEFDAGALNAGYPPYRDREHNMFYQPEQLEWWIDGVKEKTLPKDDPDYWTRLEHQYAGMAMQGMLSGSYYQGLSHDRVVEDAQYIAHALVKKLKEE